jgi:serine/threonine protein kinase
MSSGIQPTGNPDPLAETSRYTKIADLSSGSFGFVQLARNTETGELVAIKFIERGDRVNRYVEAEILNHRMLRHPHVIEYKEVFITSEYICIAMEFASGGSLFTYVQRAVRLKEAAARWFFQQLIIGLDYCHRRGVVNRDIKLENTLLQMVQGLPLPLLKICDFGYSKAHFMSAPKSKVRELPGGPSEFCKLDITMYYCIHKGLCKCHCVHSVGSETGMQCEESSSDHRGSIPAAPAKADSGARIHPGGMCDGVELHRSLCQEQQAPMQLHATARATWLYGHAGVPTSG